MQHLIFRALLVIMILLSISCAYDQSSAESSKLPVQPLHVGLPINGNTMISWVDSTEEIKIETGSEADTITYAQLKGITSAYIKIGNGSYNSLSPNIQHVLNANTTYYIKIQYGDDPNDLLSHFDNEDAWETGAYLRLSRTIFPWLTESYAASIIIEADLGDVDKKEH